MGIMTYLHRIIDSCLETFKLQNGCKESESCRPRTTYSGEGNEKTI